MNEIMSKVPEGFRELTDAEARELERHGRMFALLQERGRRIDAELDRAKLEKRMALSELALLHQQIAALNLTLGIKGEGDLVMVGERPCVRERKAEAKREAS